MQSKIFNDRQIAESSLICLNELPVTNPKCGAKVSLALDSHTSNTNLDVNSIGLKQDSLIGKTPSTPTAQTPVTPSTPTAQTPTNEVVPEVSTKSNTTQMVLIIVGILIIVSVLGYVLMRKKR